jgi:hypothetical protein
MNTKRLILSIVAIFIGVFATDYVIHEVWLKAELRAQGLKIIDAKFKPADEQSEADSKPARARKAKAT